MSLPNWCLYGHLIDMCCAFLIGFPIFLYVPWSFWLSVNYLMKYTQKEKHRGDMVKTCLFFLFLDIYRAVRLFFSSVSLSALSAIVHFPKSQAQSMPKFKCVTVNLTTLLCVYNWSIQYMQLKYLSKVLEMLFSDITQHTQSRIIIPAITHPQKPKVLRPYQ